jgi:plastocyanin
MNPAASGGILFSQRVEGGTHMRAQRFLLLILVAALTSCQMGALGPYFGGSPGGGMGTGYMGGTTGSAVIYTYAFMPPTMTIPTGVTVTWVNADGVTHTITGDGPSPAFDSGNVAYGGSYSFTFSTGGVFPYHCAIHPTMKGSITVTP